MRGQLSERELVLAAKECRGEARDALLEAFTPLIGSVARGYRGASGLGRAELMQEGVVGLLRALERYEPELELRSGRMRRGGFARRCSSWCPS